MGDNNVNRIYCNAVWPKKGSIVRAGRIYKGWNHTRVASMVGLKVSDIKRFENGEEEIPRTIAGHFEKILGVKL